MSTTSTTALLTALVAGAYLFAMAVFGTDPFESPALFTVCLSIALILATGTVALLSSWFGAPQIEYTDKQ